MTKCFRTECKNEAKVKFCSRSCAAKVNNVGVVRNGKPSKDCLLCGKPTGRGNGKFCSHSHQQQYRKDEIVRKWLSGDLDASVKQGLSVTIKRYLIEQAGYRCASPTCAVPGGWGEINPSTGRPPLEIDHIDGDAYNNSPENLIVLCPNCHALTPTYRNLNRNSTRKYRRGT